ncbi:MAG TPA: hypothetical protein VIG50_04250 [Vicinamibacteria bacterium]|jgi:hypothetical protein
MKHSKRVAAGTLAALAVVAATAARSADNGPVLRLRAAAVDIGGTPARTTMLDIGIERWTTDAEHARLAAVLKEKGADPLLEALKDVRPRAGYIRSTGSVGWDIHYARQETLSDGTRRIVLATDRPMPFWELWSRPRSVDYQYTLAEIRLGPDGKGRGTLVPAARIDYDDITNTIEVENFEQQPVRLTEVRVEK